MTVTVTRTAGPAIAGVDPAYAPCVAYALDVLSGGDGSGTADLAGVHYAVPTSEPLDTPGVWIVPGGLFGAGYGTTVPLPTPPLSQIQSVPILFGRPVVRWQGRALVVEADIVASAFVLLTRYEEWVRPDVRDEHGRFPGGESLAHRAGFLRRPIVQEYESLLRHWRRQVGLPVAAPKRTFSALLTHDVDHLRKFGRAGAPWRALAKAVLGRDRFAAIGESLAVRAGRRRDPYDTFEQLLAWDATVPAGRSAYFFLAGGRTKHDGLYDLAGPTAHRTLSLLREAGVEVGLHASYDAGRNPDRLAAEREALELVAGLDVRGNRHHGLCWREVDHGWALARAGILWDTTLGYADQAGFRLGTCRPVELFDPARRERMGLVEHPLAVMDCTLSRPGYMGLDAATAWDVVRELIGQVRTHAGEFVALWHNTELAPREGHWLDDTYRRMIAELGGEPT